MINKNLTDEQLIFLMQENSELRYFSVLVQRHEQYILRKCKSYIKDDAIAEDLCQEVLIKLFLNIKSFKGAARFSTWLFSIIHNTCIDQLRKNKKEVRQVITAKMLEELPEMIEGVDEVSEVLSTKILEELLDEISPEEKMILLLKYKEKHQIKDISFTLGLSESAVKMRLKRAREKVNKLYMIHKKKHTR